jgi:hypothetical protein
MMCKKSDDFSEEQILRQYSDLPLSLLRSLRQSTKEEAKIPFIFQREAITNDGN